MAPVILQGNDGKLFAVGLQWKRIVINEDSGGNSSASERSGYAHAAAVKSNRLVLNKGSKGEVKSVGHEKFEKQDFAALSLAQAVTLRFDQKDKCVVAIALPDNRVWVCAIADGMVINNYDFVDFAPEAAQRVRELAKRYPEGAIAYYGDVLGDSQFMNLQELQEIALANHDACVMLPVRRNEESRRKLILLGVAVLVLGGGKFGYDKYKAYKRAEAARIAAESTLPQITAQEAWDKGVAQWLAASSKATPTALIQALGVIKAMPLEITAWTLKGADCARTGPQWVCNAEYERIGGLRGSTQEFLAALPSGWTASWGAMDKATARFTTAAQAEKIELAALKEATTASLPLLSYFQTYSRAFTKLDIGPAAAVSITPAPQPDGKPTVVDPSTVKPIIVSMAVTAAGPLRSMSVLEGQPVSWRTLKFVRSNSVAPDSPEKSRLIVTEAKGDVYAIK